MSWLFLIVSILFAHRTGQYRRSQQQKKFLLTTLLYSKDLEMTPETQYYIGQVLRIYQERFPDETYRMFEYEEEE